MRIDVIIPVSGAHAAARRALESVVHGNASSVDQLIVVDDGSSPPFAPPNSQGVELVLLRSTRPRGFRVAVEDGLAACRQEKALILNSDAKLPAGFLNRVLALPDCWDLLAFLSNNAGDFSLPHSRARLGDRLLLRHHRNGQREFNEAVIRLKASQCGSAARRLVASTYFHGFCFAVRHESLRKIGGFAGNSPPSGRGLEMDIAVRMSQHNQKMFLYTGELVQHDASASTPGFKRFRQTLYASASLRLRYGPGQVRQIRQVPAEVVNLRRLFGTGSTQIHC